MAKKPRAAAKKSGNGNDSGRQDPGQPGTSQHVIDTALNLAAEKGWRDLALADIAQAAGLSLAELYGLHPSKQAILDAYRPGHRPRRAGRGRGAGGHPPRTGCSTC